MAWEGAGTGPTILFGEDKPVPDFSLPAEPGISSTPPNISSLKTCSTWGKKKPTCSMWKIVTPEIHSQKIDEAFNGSTVQF